MGLKVGLVVKNLLANARDLRDMGSIPGSRRSPGEGNDNPLQYSCLENLMDRRAWRAIVYGVTKSQTQMKQLSIHTMNKENVNIRRKNKRRKRKRGQ